MVIPFVNQFLSLGGLDHKSIRGLVHKLEESSEIMHATSFYEIGLQSKIYPFQDMDVDDTIVVQNYYSHFEVKVILKDVFKKIVNAISEQAQWSKMKNSIQSTKIEKYTWSFHEFLSIFSPT